MTATFGRGNCSADAHQSVRSRYGAPVTEGFEKRTLLVAAYPNSRLSDVMHLRPGRVNPSFRRRTRKCSIAFATVQVSNCLMASSCSKDNIIAHGQLGIG